MYGSPKFAHLIKHTATNILLQRDYLKNWYFWTSVVFAKIVVHGLKTLHLIHNGISSQKLSCSQRLWAQVQTTLFQWVVNWEERCTFTPTMMITSCLKDICVGRHGMELSCRLWEAPAEAHVSTKKHMAAERGLSPPDLGGRRCHVTDPCGTGPCWKLTEGWTAHDHPIGYLESVLLM